MSSLEGYGSTVELHPHPHGLNCIASSVLTRWQWGVKDSNLRRHCHQIYSLTPLTTRETPRVLTDPTRQPLCRPPLRPPHRPSPRRAQLRGFRYELAEGLEPTTC